MSSRDKHLKASDVFAQSTPFFGEMTSDFTRAFPRIESVTVTVTEVGEGVSDRGSSRRYTQHNLSEFIDCRNPQCFGGGFSLGSLLRLMESTGQTEGEFDEFCQGYEGSPKGRKRYGPCDNEFHVDLAVVYKPKP